MDAARATSEAGPTDAGATDAGATDRPSGDGPPADGGPPDGPSADGRDGAPPLDALPVEGCQRWRRSPADVAYLPPTTRGAEAWLASADAALLYRRGASGWEPVHEDLTAPGFLALTAGDDFVAAVGQMSIVVARGTAKTTLAPPDAPITAAWASGGDLFVGTATSVHGWDGASWRRIGDAPNGVAALWGTRTNLFIGSPRGLKRFDGMAFTDVPLPAPTGVTALAGSGSAVYGVQGSTLLRVDGAAPVAVTGIPACPGGDAPVITTVSTAGDVLAASGTCKNERPMTVVRRGETWKAYRGSGGAHVAADGTVYVDVPGRIVGDEVQPLVDTPAPPSAIFGRSVSELHGIADGRLVQLVGTDWRPVPDAPQGPVISAWQPSTGELFAVVGGALFIRPPGAAWRREGTPFAIDTAHLVKGRGNDVYLAAQVADRAQLYRWNGTVWSHLPQPCLSDLVNGTSSRLSGLWFAGRNGIHVQCKRGWEAFDGTAWSTDQGAYMRHEVGPADAPTLYQFSGRWQRKSDAGWTEWTVPRLPDGAAPGDVAAVTGSEANLVAIVDRAFGRSRQGGAWTITAPPAPLGRPTSAQQNELWSDGRHALAQSYATRPQSTATVQTLVMCNLGP